MTNLDIVLKSSDITLLTKVRIVKAMVFPVVTHGCESWTIKTAEHQGTDALNCGAGEDSWEPLDSKEIKLVNLKGNQPWILIGRTDAEAPVFQSPANSWPTGKVPSDGEGLRAEKMVSEGEMADWHYRFNGHELANFRRWWETRRPGMLQSMGLQRVGHDWVTEQQYSQSLWCCKGYLTSSNAVP